MLDCGCNAEATVGTLSGRCAEGDGACVLSPPGLRNATCGVPCLWIRASAAEWSGMTPGC